MKKVNFMTTMLLCLITIGGFSQFQLNTVPPLNGGNGSQGITFGFTTNQQILLDTIFCSFTGTGLTDVWYTTTDVSGPPNISVAGGWTQIGSANIAAAGGVGTITAIPLSIGLTILPGVNYRFFVNGNLGAPMAYSNTGTTPIPPPQGTFTDGIVTIETGDLVGYGGAAPSPGNHPRQFNGGVKYTILGGFNDAAVLSIDSPAVYCSGSQPVVATIANFGSNQINSVTVNWSVNGAAQTPLNYTGLLDTLNGSNPTTAQVNLGTFTFPQGLNTIEVYTSMPNGQADTSNFNDTLRTLSGPSLAGNFTIDPALPASSTNYTSFTSLANALNTFGVCAPVYVTVAAGTYNEVFNLNNVVGLSAINTLTIDGVDSSLVTLTETFTTNGALIGLNGVSHTTVKNMTLLSPSTITLDHFGVHLSNGSNHDSLLNLHILMNPLNTTGAFPIGASSAINNDFGEGDNANYTTVMNCNLEGGDYSVHFEGGAAGSWNVGNKFINVTCTNMDEYGFYFDEQDSVEVRGSSVSGNRNINGDGIYGFDCMNFVVSGNSVNVPDWGIYFSDANSDRTPDRFAEISNNMVISQNDYGIYLIDALKVNIWYNSVYVEGTIEAMSITGTLTDTLDMRNNILSSVNSLAFEILRPDSIFLKFDNNVYNTGGTNLLSIDGTFYADLAAYQTAQPLYNINSLEGDPSFLSPTDLHIVGALVNNTGDNSVPILVDIDGDSRPITGSTTVDPGADEFDPPLCPPVSNLSIANLTGDSITIFWTGGGNNYQYNIVTAGSPIGSGVLVVTPLDSSRVGGIMPSNSYELYVREICGRSDTSLWVGPISFQTPCATPSPVVLPYVQDFESVSGTLVGDGIVTCNSVANWNLVTSSQTDGRVRFGTDAIGTFNGTGHATLDEVQNNQPVNQLILTLNMSNYTTSGLELYFEYFDHGDETHPGDRVWVRGSAADPWVEIYDLAPGTTTNGVIYPVGPLDIDATLAGAGQTVSSTFQIAFGQEDNTNATTQTGVDGISFDDIRIELLSANDAGVSEILSPQLPLCPGTVTPVVAVENFGTDTLKSFTVVWNVNGFLDSMLFTNQSIPPDSVGSVSIGSLNVMSGVSYDLSIYTVRPNGFADGRLSNDTVTFNGLQTGIAGGAYTINAAMATGGSNFQSFTDFATTVSNFGICGPITVDVVANSGPYNEQVVFTGVEGTNSTNTITINGNGDTLAFGSTTSANRAVITVDNSSWITIDDLVIDARGATYGWGVHLTNATHHVQLLNSDVLTDLVSTSSVNFSCIIITNSPTSTTTASDVEYVTVDNCLLSGGYYGISARGTSGSNSRKFRFTNNTVEDNYFSGIYVQYSDSALVEGNDISRPNRTNSTTYYGIYMVTNTSNALINANRVHNTSDQMLTSTSALYPIVISGDALAGDENYFTNNIVYNINGSGTIYGIYDQGSNGTYYYHNTVSLDDVSSTSSSVTRAFYQSSASSNSAFVNNILSVTRGGTGVKHGIYLNGSTTTIAVDYNDVYMNSAGTGTQFYGRLGTADQATLLDWQNNTTFGLNSFETDPRFFDIATDDYTPRASVLNNTALPTFVSEDLFGNARGAAPDFGAIEFTPSAANNAALTELVSPVYTTDTCYGTNESVVIRVRNFGGSALDFTVDNMDVVVDVTGSVTNTLSITVNNNSLNGGNPLAIGDEIDIPVGTVDMTAIGGYDFNAYVTLVGDTFPNNDTLLTSLTLLPYTGGTIEGSDTICLGDTAFLSTSNFVGDIQWQSFDGTNWVDIVGETSSDIAVDPIVITDYRVLACGASPSDTITVNPIDLSVAPIAQGDTAIVICGTPGTATATASSTNPNASFAWFTTATGITEVDTTGGTFSLNAGTDSLSFNITNTVNGLPNIDTVWVAEVTSGGAGAHTLKISELDPGNTDAIEIQNVSSQTIDVTGWTVAVSNDYNDINLVNPIVQTLSGTLAPDATLYWTDGTVNPWGSNLFWNQSGSPGWGIILDAQGNIVDFMAFDWAAADIMAMNTTIAGFTVTPGLSGDWIGTGTTGNGVATGSSIYRMGTDDNDDATDWSFQLSNLGVANVGLVTPFAGGRCESPRTMAIVMVDCLVGLDNLSTETATLRISPNPSNGLFTLNINTPQEEDFNLTVRDLSGKVIFEESVNVNGEYRDDLDFTNLAKGVYYMQIQTGTESKVEKLIIQ